MKNAPVACLSSLSKAILFIALAAAVAVAADPTAKAEDDPDGSTAAKAKAGQPYVARFQIAGEVKPSQFKAFKKKCAKALAKAASNSRNGGYTVKCEKVRGWDCNGSGDPYGCVSGTVAIRYNPPTHLVNKFIGVIADGAFEDELDDLDIDAKGFGDGSASSSSSSSEDGDDDDDDDDDDDGDECHKLRSDCLKDDDAECCAMWLNKKCNYECDKIFNHNGKKNCFQDVGKIYLKTQDDYELVPLLL